MILSLPEELLFCVLSYLDVIPLLRMRSLNKNLYEQCSKDDAGWVRLCQLLWRDKVYVPAEFSTRPSMDSYRRSLHDASSRDFFRHNSKDILCESSYDEFIFDETTEVGPIWSFRFKESAGPDWTSWDPWWNGNQARKFVFLKDGSICYYLFHGTDYQHDDLIPDPETNGRLLPSGEGMILHPSFSMTWRFSARPLDLPPRAMGSYLRITVGGRDVPTYVVRRSPTGNWGFIVESCWGVYTNFDLPLRRVHSNTTNNLATSCSRRNLRNEDHGGEDDDKNFRLLCDDKTMKVTNEIQWREALLYNFGALTLPEGEHASDDFDRMFVFRQVPQSQDTR
jgi:F-box domain